MSVGSGFGLEAEDKRKHIIMCSNRIEVSGQALLPLGNKMWGPSEISVSRHRCTPVTKRNWGLREDTGNTASAHTGPETSKRNTLWGIIHHGIGSSVIYRVHVSYSLLHEGRG